jgi:Terpene cyclase DEP1
VNRKNIYLLLCALGVALLYSQFIPWLMENGLHIGLLFRQLFANRIGGFFGLDVLVSNVVLVGFIRAEGQRLGVRLL